MTTTVYIGENVRGEEMKRIFITAPTLESAHRTTLRMIANGRTRTATPDEIKEFEKDYKFKSEHYRGTAQ